MLSNHPNQQHKSSPSSSVGLEGLRSFISELNSAMSSRDELPGSPVREHRLLELASFTEASNASLESGSQPDPSNSIEAPSDNPREVRRRERAAAIRSRLLAAQNEPDSTHPAQSWPNKYSALMIKTNQNKHLVPGAEEKFRDERIDAYTKIELDFDYRRSGRGYRLPTQEEKELFDLMKNKVIETLRSSMPQAPSLLRESNHFRFFEPRVKIEGESRTIFTMASLRNISGGSLIYSNDLDFYGRWLAIDKKIGPAYIEIYNTTDRITRTDNDPSESWKTGEFDISKLGFQSGQGGGTASQDVQFNYRILYSPQALTHEMRSLDSPTAVKKFLTPGFEGSFVFYRLLRAAGAATGVPLEKISPADISTPITIQRLSPHGPDPIHGTTYRVIFNDFNRQADVRIQLRVALNPTEERMLAQESQITLGTYWRIRERRGIVHFNIIT